MNTATDEILVKASVGSIDCAVDRPKGLARGAAVIGHPHPLFGGTRENKVVQTLARAFVALGFVAWRPNFRGVGASSGTHDQGNGETQDFIELVAHARAEFGAQAPYALAGFSFGSMVAARACESLGAQGQPPEALVLVGTATSRWQVPDVPAHTLVVHGELDDTVPLATVLDWARPQALPVVVMPGTDHFFHQRLTTLKQLVMRHVAGGRIDA